MRPGHWFGTAIVSAAAILGAAPASHAQEIKFWTLSFDNPNMAKTFQSIIKDFEAANPGVTIKLENRGTDEHKSALRVAGGSDQAPDIYYMWGGLGLGGEFVKSGLGLPMDKYYAEYKWDDQFIDPALTFSKQYPGGRYGLPFTFRGEAIYYNKALFEKAGITSLPTTYDELLADADKLTAAGIPAFTFGGTVNWHVMRLMDEILEIQCGPEKHDALMAMKLNWADEACATKSFEELHKWTSKYILKPFMGIDQQQSFNLFLAGRAAMMLEGNWLVGQLRNANKLADYGVFPFPGASRLYGFAEYDYISTKSKNPDIAAKFLNYLESTPVQQANVELFGGPANVNKNVKSASTDALDLAWGKIFGQFHDVFVNGVTVVRGGYAGHGECFAHPQDLLWWAKGGTLRGESWRRIAFLRSILEEDVVNGLTPAPEEWPWQRVSMASDGEVRLIYLGEHQPGLWIAGLPTDDRPYEVDVIDAWNMTVTPAKRVPRPSFPKLRQRGGALRDPQPLASFAVELPSTPYQAVRVRSPRTGAV